MNIRRRIEDLAIDILKKFTNYYSQADKEVLADMICNALPKQPEWISVEEMLPQEGGEYLVWNDFHKAIVGHYWAKGRYFISKAVSVTHWMPLPEPPKGVIQ